MLDIKNLKEYLYKDGILQFRKLNKNSIKKKFPLIYDFIKDDYSTKLYMLLNNIKNIPKCKNIECKNDVKLKNISNGFREFCSKKCISQYQQYDKKFSEKIAKTKLSKSLLRKKYPELNIHRDPHNKNYFILNDYCEHSPIKIYGTIFNKLYNQNQNLCQRCKDEIIENFIPTNKDYEEFRKDFDIFYEKYKYLFNEIWFKRFYPKEYKTIISWSNHLSNVSLSEAIYLFKNNLKDKPICSACEKNFTHFNHSSLSYTNFCDSYACQKNTSLGELELYEFIKHIYKNKEDIQHKFYLEGNEFDIFIKNKNIAIEFNGLYWHGEKVQTNKNYHFNKLKLCEKYGIRLFTIWEDDWINKRQIIESILYNSLNLNQEKIYARNTIVKNVSFKESKEFLKNNHLQGNCNSSIRLGLYFNNELVSLMTFGKRKINRLSQIELLRFCNKINMTIIGGASKLFKNFIETYDPDYIISYANLDISIGDLYDKLGFIFEKYTDVNYWWVKDKIKYHRSNFMKHTLINNDKLKTESEIMRKNGFYKLYGTGNIKYKWIKKERP